MKTDEGKSLYRTTVYLYRYLESDTTTNAQYGHAAVCALFLIRIKELTTKKQVKRSYVYCKLKWFIAFTN
jgi:hypothetical protein